MDVVKTEGYLRLCVALLLGLTCCLVGFDSQTKVVFASIPKHVTFTDKNLLASLLSTIYHMQGVWTLIESAAAAYNLVQAVMIRYGVISDGSKGPCKRNMAWISFFLDQVAAYSVFAAYSAALEASVVVITGVKIFEWMKWCDRYTRFCFQIGGALTCGFVASLCLILLSSISAFNLFRLYSPQHFLLLKINS